MNKEDIHNSIAEIVKEVRNDEGCFIPYVGVHYEKGIPYRHSKDIKVLIVGPRHYCDAAYNSRNVLSGLSDEERGELRQETKSHQDVVANFDTMNNKEIRFKPGCVLDNAKFCLTAEAHSEFRCPVFKDELCPISGTCKYQINDITDCHNNIIGLVNCAQKRQLCCETLYAIYEFLHQPLIESSRLGNNYFATVTNHLIKHLHFEKDSQKYSIEEIWDKIAFMNFIQRYVPLLNCSTSKEIEKHIDYSVDCSFLSRVVDALKPDVIIVTMECVYIQISVYIEENNKKQNKQNKIDLTDYSLQDDMTSLFYVFKRKSNVILSTIKEKYVDVLFEKDCMLESFNSKQEKIKSSNLAAFIIGMIGGLTELISTMQEKESAIDGVKKRKISDIEAYIKRTIIERFLKYLDEIQEDDKDDNNKKLKNYLKTDPNCPNFLRKLKEKKKKEENIRITKCDQWIRKAKFDLKKKGNNNEKYSKGFKIVKEILSNSLDEIIDTKTHDL